VLTFVEDHPGRPNGASHNARAGARLIGAPRLRMYVAEHGVEHAVISTAEMMQKWHQKEPRIIHAIYVVHIEFWRQDWDFVACVSDHALQLARAGQLHIVLCYHEADSPATLQAHVARMAEKNCVDLEKIRIISANTSARELDFFAWFPDHELFYWHLSRNLPVIPPHTAPRCRDSTLLVRTHKWWRAQLVQHLQDLKLISNSFWSYHAVDLGEPESANPIETWIWPGLVDRMRELVATAPHTCDHFTADEANQHDLLESFLYTDAYYHIVAETFWDADGSHGAFLTEKTFKAIRHAQPFVIAGTVGSLATLRELGYRTYDDIIDNTYDTVADNTQRFRALISAIARLQHQDLLEFSGRAYSAALHNQRHFLAPKADRIHKLEKDLKLDV